MDSSDPFPSLRVVGDMNDRPFISLRRVPLMTTRSTAFSPLSKQQPAEICPTSIEIAWPVTAGLGVRVLISLGQTPSRWYSMQLQLLPPGANFQHTAIPLQAT
ncbi:hypothetical protein AVEN_59664-1 [Araneus ventricosus]|uniref:Uncharacterized protein n=1 Tax=Araneus ventricosus TaxID=182803 RepID=A0A4Y2BMN5_ARAVE|nr:hypothetical protein AVEN_59664-1 [Araneus ventricosus]